jgi:hypothetical protein
MKHPSYILVFFAVLLTLSGCEDKEKKPDFVSQSLQEVVAPQPSHAAQTSRAHSTNTAQTITPQNAPKSPIGIVVKDDKIIIDTQQTKAFLEALTRKLDSGFKKIEHDLRQNKIPSPNPTGISISKDRIEVDLNKTEQFMEKWIKSMESVGRELDNVFRELDQSLQP